MTGIPEGETVWNYRIVKRKCHDGYIYGMHEAYYNHNEALQGWTENPYWTEQDDGDFLATLDRYALAHKAGKSMPDWAIGYSDAEYLDTLKYMRHAVSQPIIDEDKVLERWGE